MIEWGNRFGEGKKEGRIHSFNGIFINGESNFLYEKAHMGTAQLTLMSVTVIKGLTKEKH